MERQCQLLVSVNRHSTKCHGANEIFLSKDIGSCNYIADFVDNSHGSSYFRQIDVWQNILEPKNSLSFAKSVNELERKKHRLENGENQLGLKDASNSFARQLHKLGKYEILENKWKLKYFLVKKWQVLCQLVFDICVF